MNFTKPSAFPLLLAAALLPAPGPALAAGALAVPNGSFENPVVAGPFPVDNNVADWTKTPQPDWYDPEMFGGITWHQTSGVFPNPPPGQGGHIENLDGHQALYLFSFPTAGLFQELGAAFAAGLRYDLTVAARGGGGLPEGSLLQISLYYADGGDRVPIASTMVGYSAAGFPDPARLVDFTVSTPAVTDGSPWLGQPIGVAIEAAVPQPSQGYWDIDNVRVLAVPEPGALGLVALGLGGFWLLRRRG
ncbi:MAG TPA: PEP-CTERM sorting domain-containing protein [Verrucomicrobiota bacterium]|nr:PEP-CTERM sorting domain-containing protein [Verrucomicrobiota bacterium]